MDRTKRILTNFVRNRYTRSEYFSVYRELEENDENGSFLNEVEDQWNKIDEKKAVEFRKDRIWNNISQQTYLGSIKQAISMWQYLQKVAAILFLPLLLTSLYFLYSENNDLGKVAFAEIQCPPGARTTFELPDGTTGFLNSGSSLKYPIDFAKSRNVSINGEAYFDVFHDKEHPFEVHTSNLNIKVLGTMFNVVAYEDDQTEQVILEEGSVEVLSGKGELISQLAPNQKLTLDTENRSYRKEDIEATKYISWTEGKLMFRNDNLHDVMYRLSRWYNVDFQIEDGELVDFTFRATFVDEPIEEVFKLLSLSAPIRFEEQVRKRNANGEYERRLIIIKPN